jgi:hypothetical protein
MIRKNMIMIALLVQGYMVFASQKPNIDLKQSNDELRGSRGLAKSQEMPKSPRKPAAVCCAYASMPCYPHYWGSDAARMEMKPLDPHGFHSDCP